MEAKQSGLDEAAWGRGQLAWGRGQAALAVGGYMRGRQDLLLHPKTPSTAT